MIPGKRYTPELALAIGWRRKWLMLIPIVLIATVSIAVIYRLPDKYRSETAILVVPQRVPENYVRSSVTTKIEDRLRSINQQVRSRTKLERIIEDFNLYADRRKTDIMQDIVDDMSDAIDVEIVQGDIFRVAFTSDNPRTAQQVTDRLATFFVDESLKDRTTVAEGASEFLETQVAEAERKLRDTEAKISEYKRQHDGELPDQVTANLQGFNQATMQLGMVKQSLDRSRDMESDKQRRISDLAALVEQAAALPVTAGVDPNAPPSKAALLEAARAALRDEERRHTKGNPQYDKIAARVAQLQKEAEEESAANATLGPSVDAQPVNRVQMQRQKDLDEQKLELERIKKDIVNLTAQEAQWKKQMGEYQRRLEAAPLRDTEIIELTRGYASLKAQYESLSSKKLESQVSANLERRQIGEQFRIIDPARLPEKPSSPNRERLYLISIIMAIVVGLGFAAGAEYLDRGMRSEDDVRLALALPVLATIPVINSTPAKKKWFRRKAIVASAAAVALSAFAGAAWIALRVLR